MRDGPHSNSQDDQNTSRVISIRQRGNLWDSALQNLPGAGCGYNRAHDMAQTHAHWAGSPAASSTRADSCAGCLRDARIQRLSTFQMPPRSARLPHEPCGRLCPERKIDTLEETNAVSHDSSTSDPPPLPGRLRQRNEGELPSPVCKTAGSTRSVDDCAPSRTRWRGLAPQTPF